MKKILMITMLLMSAFSFAQGQGQAEIKFDKIEHNFGTFSLKSNPVQETTFTFTNTGKAPLVLNQVVASCGCTIPAYDKKPIAPGQKGTIKVTYNGKGKFAGRFKKSITVRSNAATEMIRLYVTGEMTD